jgi:hypothetical protein
VRRLLGRFTRTPPTAGVASPPALPPGGSAPRPRELDYSRTLPGRLFILSLGLLVPLVLARLFAALPAFVEIFRKVVSLSLIGSGYARGDRDPA